MTIGDIDIEVIVQSREGRSCSLSRPDRINCPKMQVMSLTFPVRRGSGIRGRPDPDSQCTFGLTEQCTRSYLAPDILELPDNVPTQEVFDVYSHVHLALCCQ